MGDQATCIKAKSHVATQEHVDAYDMTLVALRLNEVVDVALLRDGTYSELPKGYAWFQGKDEEIGIDEGGLKEIVECVKELNPKLFKLQKLTGDL